MKQAQNYDVVFKTELGAIGLVFDGKDLVAINYLDKKQAQKFDAKHVESGQVDGRLATAVKNKIKKYLASKSAVALPNIQIQLNATDFQKKVLFQLQKIPYGETRTYGEIAKTLKTSPRAVGNACRRNPLPIIIPCHRVVAANSIGGYDGAKSGELLDIKRYLLKKEGVNLAG